MRRVADRLLELESFGVVNPSEARRRLLKSTRGLRIEADTSDLDAMAAVAYYVIDQIRSNHEKRADRVLTAGEECLTAGNEGVKNLVWVGLVEDLGNITSHDDVAVSPQQIRSRLGPRMIQAWDSVDVFWLEVALHKPSLDPEGKGVTIDQYRSVESPELRRIIQTSHRSMSDGSFVGLADVLRYETRTGRGMGHRGLLQ